MVYKTGNIPPCIKIKVVETYLKEKQPLRKLARSLSVSHQALWKWVKLYKESIGNFKRVKIYKKKFSRDIEIKVMLLKEHDPSLSINRARQSVIKEGINISNKGIWGIWKRHGLVYRKERRKLDPLDIFSEPTPQNEYAIEIAKVFVEKGDYRSATKILNELPSLPECPLLRKIPERYLSLRRRLERLYSEIGEIPYPQFLRKIKQLGKSLERKSYVYTSIIADFLELNALDWIREPEKKMLVLKRLEKKLRGIRDCSLWFLFYFEQASTYCDLLKIPQALKIIKKCRRLVHLLPYIYYWEHFADLVTFVGKYKVAFCFYKKIFESEKDENTTARITLKMAIYGHSYAGEYSDCKKILMRSQALRSSVGFGPTYSLIRAYLSFGQSNLANASQFFLESLEMAYKGQLHNRIYAASLGLASVSMAVNKKADARMYLQKYLPLMKKYRLASEELILRCLANSAVAMHKEFLQIPPLYLLRLLMQSKQTMKLEAYRKAFGFAQRKGLLGLFHRWIVFFPEVIMRLLEKGKKTGLPKAILRFPIFNQNVPVYHIRFLGNFVVFRNQRYLKTKLSPKEKALLVQIATRANEPNKFISLKELFNNFWPNSDKPIGFLSHLLIKIKKKLMIPGYLIGISVRYGESAVVDRGLYFTTDYRDFEIVLAQAKALERAGEWGFARKEYLRAFKLFRGEPFRKNFDEWSLNLRHKILTELEIEVVNFAKSCLERGNKRDARKILEKTLKIIPNSDEVKKISEDLKL